MIEDCHYKTRVLTCPSSRLSSSVRHAAQSLPDMFPILPKSEITAVTNEANDIEAQHCNYYNQGHVLRPSYVSEKVGINENILQ